jgi:hypothetical protein
MVLVFFSRFVFTGTRVSCARVRHSLSWVFDVLFYRYSRRRISTNDRRAMLETYVHLVFTNAPRLNVKKKKKRKKSPMHSIEIPRALVLQTFQWCVLLLLLRVYSFNDINIPCDAISKRKARTPQTWYSVRKVIILYSENFGRSTVHTRAKCSHVFRASNASLVALFLSHNINRWARISSISLCFHVIVNKLILRTPRNDYFDSMTTIPEGYNIRLPKK